MLISGMSGNEVYCLAQKGLSPGEIVVGNSVCSMGSVARSADSDKLWPAARSPR